MRRNIGTMQRLVQLITGLACLGLYGVLTPPWQYLAVLGLIPLSSALAGFWSVQTWLGRNRSQPWANGWSRNGHRAPAGVKARRRRYLPPVSSDSRFDLAPRGPRIVDIARRPVIGGWERQGRQLVSSDNLRPPARLRGPGIEDAHGA